MSKCWYCNEELTTANYCDEHIGICTKCYGSMFQVSNEFVKGLMGKISDLEAKLAESEKRVKDLEFRNKNIEHLLKVAPNANAGQRQRIVELKEINHKLKQQLAESEKRIEIARNVKQARIDSLELDKKICEEHKQVIFNQLLEKCKEAEQDKISFCIEQLEKVKEVERLVIDEYGIANWYVKVYEIDQQINELKEKK